MAGTSGEEADVAPEELGGHHDWLPAGGLLSGGLGHSHFAGLRAVRRKERASPAFYVLSVMEDADKVLRLAQGLAPFPVFANLRCGAWYVPPAARAGTCYFKSTDGHTGNWDFSIKRLNWHLLGPAAEKGGVVLVDSTRRGKDWPDALSKTVPIWCLVLNRAAALLRGEEGPVEDCLPPWLPGSEREQILRRVPGWARACLGVLSASMRKSLMQALGERTLRPAWRSAWDQGGDSVVAGTRSAACIVVVCVCASSAATAAAAREHHSWTYIQGAGDDDENWSQGLSPEVFWSRADELRAAARRDPADCEELVNELVDACASRRGRVQLSTNGHVPALARVGDTSIVVGSLEHCAAPERAKASAAVVVTNTGEELADSVLVGLPRLRCVLAIAPQITGNPCNDFWIKSILPRSIVFARGVLRSAPRDSVSAPAALAILHTSGAAVVHAQAVVAALLVALHHDGVEGRGPAESAAWPDPKFDETLSTAADERILDKHCIRRRLAFLQACLPSAPQPTRGLVKQLTRFFIGERGPAIAGIPVQLACPWRDLVCTAEAASAQTAPAPGAAEPLVGA